MSESHGAPGPYDAVAHERWLVGRSKKAKQVNELLQKLEKAAAVAKAILAQTILANPDTVIMQLSVDEALLLNRYVTSLKDHLHRMTVRAKSDIERFEELSTGKDL